jgi:hypothetical protein
MWKPDASVIITAEQKVLDQREATRARFEHAIQEMVDAKPLEKDFRDGVTLASYAASTNPVWQAQALAFIAWRDEVWAYAYTQLELALTGQRDIPTVEDFLSELPVISWPE